METAAHKTFPRRKFPVLAIVGRPNVGKSTLFNKILGERKAIVDDFPGVTRDRNYAEASWGDTKFLLVDTGGLESATGGNLEKQVQEQSQRAVDEADVVLFLFDGKSGLSPLDREAVDLLRKSSKPVFFAVNKLDSQRRAENLYEFYDLGIDRLYSISAEHGLGIPDLMADLVAQLPEPESDEERAHEETSRAVRIAVVGRPNVGKSTLVNRLLGFERSVVDAAPGTTRDALDTPFVLDGERCLLIDTAGIRRKARIAARVERFSVSRSLRSVDRGDLVLHVINGVEGVTDQDAQILSYGVERGKALLLVINKWDAVAQAGGGVENYRDEVRYRLSFLEFVPIAFISAATGFGVRKMLDTAARLVRAYRRKISTASVNQALQRIVRAHSAPLYGGKAVKFYYGTQTGTKPPTFTFFVNYPAGVPESYRRYLIAQLRAQLGLEHAPVRIHLRARREEGKAKRA